VLIVSDSSLVCDALRRGFAHAFEDVAVAASLDRLESDQDWQSRVVIFDVSEPIGAVAKLTALGASIELSRWILLLRTTQDPLSFQSLIGQIGAILPSQASVGEVVLAAQLIGHGLVLVPAEMLSHAALTASRSIERPANYPVLTERESEVLKLIAEGRSNKAIARNLNLSDSTVRVHVRSLLRKLKLQNRTQAALMASRYA
jgi:two-component system, NarL family, nitrate/nitrite response regulator NarL